MCHLVTSTTQGTIKNPTAFHSAPQKTNFQLRTNCQSERNVTKLDANTGKPPWPIANMKERSIQSLIFLIEVSEKDMPSIMQLEQVVYFFLPRVKPLLLGFSSFPSPEDRGSVCDRVGEVAVEPDAKFSLFIQTLASSYLKQITTVDYIT